MLRLYFTFGVLRECAKLIPLLIVSACLVVSAHPDTTPTSIVPLCPGLTIVTAIRQPQGDYESIKRIESVTPEAVRLRYSSYMPDPKGDYDLPEYDPHGLKPKPPPWLPYSIYRTMLGADLEAATAYLQQFAPSGIPETVRGVTSLGISRKVFRELKAGKPVALTIYQPVSPGNPLKEDGSPTMSLMDYRLSGEMTLVDQKQVPISVLVNDRPTTLPAIHAHGKFLWDEGDFFFLDDETNPISLKFTIGNAAHPQRDQLLVIKITYACPTPLDGNAPAATGVIEQALADKKPVDIYSIYFAFNSDAIREESEPTLKEIAEVLRRHPDWKLQVNGHTDGVGSDQYNLDLSRRRAAAVKDTLVKRYAIDASRLTTAGFGKSQPKDTNDTLEGRARNRRVELMRQS